MSSSQSEYWFRASALIQPDMTRYYITRNRGYIVRYFQVHGDYNPCHVGTALDLCRLFDLFLVDRAHFGLAFLAL